MFSFYYSLCFPSAIAVFKVHWIFSQYIDYKKLYVIYKTKTTKVYNYLKTGYVAIMIETIQFQRNTVEASQNFQCRICCFEKMFTIKLCSKTQAVFQCKHPWTTY